MLSIIQSIAGSVLSAFLIVIFATFLVLLLDFLFPAAKKWTRLMLFIIAVSIVLQPAFEQFVFIRDVTRSIAMAFIGIYPVLAASFVISGGAFSLLNFQPAMLLFANGVVVLSEKVLIPILATALLLDILSRLQPAMPFSKMSDLLRTTLLGAASASVAAYAIFITTGGTISWAMSGVTSEPIKELIRQNIPLIGGLLTDSIGAVSSYTSGASIFIGGWLIITVWTVALLPTLKTLIIGFLYRWTAALIEPFANEDLTGVLDDIGKSMFVLCAVSFLVAFAFIYTAIFSIILIKLMAVAR